MNPVEFVGFLGGGIGLLQAVPQFVRVRRLGHGEGVSLSTWAMMFTVAASWCGYGLRIGANPVAFTNLAGAVLNGAVVIALLRTLRVPRWAPYVGLPVLAAVMIGLAQVLPLSVVSAFLVAMTLSRAPQVWASIQQRAHGERSAVSLTSLAITLTSLVCWGLWSFLARQPLVTLTTAIAMALTLTITAIELSGHRRAGLAAA